MDAVVLTFDIGTQSCRAAIVDDKGTILSQTQEKFVSPYFSKNPGWAEQTGQFYWDSICKVSKQLQANAGELWNKIAAVSITTIRDTTICVDESGTPLRPAILWLDKREASVSEPLPLVKQALFTATGMRESVALIRKISVCNWIMQNEPEIWKKTYKYLMLSGYMHFCLCGKMIDSTASIIGHVPFDYKKRCWQKTSDLTYCIFPIPREKFCELCEPGDIIGKITRTASEQSGIPEGLPLVATGSDKGCETLGMGVIDTSMASLSFGTTATVQTTSASYYEAIPLMPPYPAPIPGHYNPEIEIFRGYWMITWFKNEFAHKEVETAHAKGILPEEALDSLLTQAPPGSMGLVVQPYWGPGLNHPDAKGAMIGFGDVHTKAHVYRAVIEGLAFALLEGVHILEKKGNTRIRKLAVSGGASQSDQICQISADIFDRPLVRGKTTETSGLGAAIVTSAGVGLHPSIRQAMESMVSYDRIFEPDPERSLIYRELFENVYLGIYKALKPLYRNIRDITGYPES